MSRSNHPLASLPDLHPTPHSHTIPRHYTSWQYDYESTHKMSYYNIPLVYIHYITRSESFWHRAETMATSFFILHIQKQCLWLTEWSFHVMLSHIPATAGANVWREPRGHGPYIDVLIMVRGWNVGHTLDTISFQTERDTLSFRNYFMQNWNLFLKCVINISCFIIPKT